MNYIKQFDGIRAIAVIFVVIEHWVPKSVELYLPWGTIGVDVFFVLSGFLITRILLNNREKDGFSDNKSLQWGAIKNFYVRRSLRIFPIYYLMLAILFISSRVFPNPIPQDWLFYVTYIQNILFYFNNAFPGGKLSPFWSLAVEEQFYMIWPWVILFAGKRSILPILISGILFGTTCSILLPLVFPAYTLSPVLTPSCLHALCMGGLLAYLVTYKNEILKTFSKPIQILGILSIISYLAFKWFLPGFILLDRLLISLTAFSIFTAIVGNRSTPLNSILNSGTLVAIGKVSYGIYVYHNFIPAIVRALFIRTGLAENNMDDYILLLPLSSFLNYFIFYTICLGILLLTSFGSFYLIEQPFLRLKDRFS